MSRRARHLPGTPIGAEGAPRANLRRQVARALAGRYRHPGGGMIGICETCGGAGCGACGRSGVVARPEGRREREA
ncbi:MAG TPA: hypothetical protein VHA80_05570 [Solirubrobacterales bacterium]|nr:hypothetical protein [Solirubrobacterales bacterium]